jgi:hypothetical protein
MLLSLSWPPRLLLLHLPSAYLLRKICTITYAPMTRSEFSRTSSCYCLLKFAVTIYISLIGSQLIGYGCAGRCVFSYAFLVSYVYLLGIMRSFLVYPTFAYYPQLMPQVQLFDVLHRGQFANSQKTRIRFFWIIFVGIFVWEWFPVRHAF